MGDQKTKLVETERSQVREEIEQLYFDLEPTDVMGKSLYIKLNSFSQAKLDMTLGAHRVLYAVNSQMSSFAFDTDVSWVRITNAKLRELYPKWQRNNNLPTILSEVVDELMDLRFQIQDGGNWVKYRLVQKAAYYRGELFILVDRAAQQLMMSIDDPALQMGHFTSGTIQDISDLTTPYQMRLFDLAKSYSYRGYFEYTDIDELRDQLGVKDGLYKQNFHLKQRVLEPGCEAISKRTPLTLSVSNIKQGKKVIGFRFMVSTDREKLTDDRLAAMTSLIEQGVKESVAQTLAAVNDAEVVERYVWAFSTLKAKKGYGVPWLVAAIRDRYNLEIFRQHPAEEVHRQIVQLKRNTAFSRFELLPERERIMWLREFSHWVSDLAPATIREHWQVNGPECLKNMVDVRNAFVDFVRNHPKCPKSIRVASDKGA